jgi:hypothetical protein
MYPPADFVALRPIMRNNVRAFNEGDEMYAASVESLGLVVGEDVRAVRPMGERPAGNASRAAWARYALLQGATPEEVDEMNRNDLRAKYGQADDDAAEAVDVATSVDEPEGDGDADAVADNV